MRDGEDIDGAGMTPATVAETTAALLSAGQVIDLWSRLAALVTGMLILLLLTNRQSLYLVAGALLSLLGALGQFYYAARVAVDAQLFANWAKRWHMLSSVPNQAGRVADDLSSFDEVIGALSASRQRHPAMPSRDLPCRQGGALRLLRRQSACFAMQIGFLAASLASAFWLWQPAGLPS